MKHSDVVFLEAGDIAEIHDRALTAWGGMPGLRDAGLLASASAVPQASAFGGLAYPTLATMATALCHPIIKNHCFVDGNKRTAAGALVAFLRANEVAVRLGLAWEETFVGLAAGSVSRDAFAVLLTGAMGQDVDIIAD